MGTDVACSLRIYFGSVYGTAAGFAKVLQQEGRSRGFNALVIDLEEFSPVELAQSIPSVFVVACTGEGEPTENAAKFYSYIKNEHGALSSTTLALLPYTVFGLGSRLYKNFNKVGRTTDQFLCALGGRRVFDYGEGDDSGSLEDDFMAWTARLWDALPSPCPPPRSASCASALELTFDLRFSTASAIRLPRRSTDFPEHNFLSSTRHFFTAPALKVLVNRELRADTSGGSTRHIELSLENSGLSYLPADNLAILPHNPADLVQAFAAALELDTESVFSLLPVDKATFRHPFPSPCSVLTALTEYLDIKRIAPKQVLSQLLPYLTEPTEARWLETVLSPEDGNRAYKTEVVGKRRSIADVVVRSLPSLRIPLVDLLHILPAMCLRYYTISSSSAIFPNEVHLTVAAYLFKTSEDLLVGGLTTSMLQGFLPGSSCRAFVKASSFRLPPPATPVVMIAIGTGLAPMRAMLQDREATAKGLEKPAVTVLYFGCKKQAVDYIYRDELERFLEHSVLTELHLAFSQDGPEKVYVQHLMREPDNAARLEELILTQNAHLYVCGGTAMGADVNKTVVDILCRDNRMSLVEASLYVSKMMAVGRYTQELWTP